MEEIQKKPKGLLVFNIILIILFLGFFITFFVLLYGIDGIIEYNPNPYPNYNY